MFFGKYFSYSIVTIIKTEAGLPMFNITDNAARKAIELLKGEGKEGHGLRIYTVQGGG